MGNTVFVLPEGFKCITDFTKWEAVFYNKISKPVLYRAFKVAYPIIFLKSSSLMMGILSSVAFFNFSGPILSPAIR